MRKPRATACNKCGSLFTENNPRCEYKKAVCRLCHNARMRVYNNSHKDKVSARKKDMKLRLVPKYRRMVWDAYGNACACCGETRHEFLTLEHKEGGGNKHRRKRHIIGVLLDIIRAGYPSKYCLFCMNCNHATRDGKPCPHELERRQQIIAAD